MYVMLGTFKIGMLITVDEAELLTEALRLLNEKHESERTMTHKQKDRMINMIVKIEREIMEARERPERAQHESDY
jgi:hypothetical protein